MRFTLGTRNLAGVVGNFVAADRRAQKEILGAVKSAGFRTQALAKQLAPVDTGYLKKNLRLAFTADKYGYEVGWREEDFVGQRNARGEVITAFYPIYTEFGTRFMAARPCLFPASEEARKTFTADLSAALRRAFARQAR